MSKPKHLPIAVTTLQKHLARMLDVLTQEVEYRWHQGWQVAFRIEREKWDKLLPTQIRAIQAHSFDQQNYGPLHYLVVFKMFSMRPGVKKHHPDPGRLQNPK